MLPSLRPNGLRLEGTLQSYMNSASHFMRLGLAKSSLKMYDSPWFYFTSICAAFSVPVMPVSNPMICAFIVHCFKSRKMQPSSIKASVAGIQFHLRCADLCSLLGNPLFASSSMALKKSIQEAMISAFPSHYL